MIISNCDIISLSIIPALLTWEKIYYLFSYGLIQLLDKKFYYYFFLDTNSNLNCNLTEKEMPI